MTKVMNDVERYEYAEKMLELWREGKEPTEAEFSEVFGEDEPSEEDQEIIKQLIQDMIQHEKELDASDDSEEASSDSEEVSYQADQDPS